MKKLLVVVDMQEDFISGSLGTKEAEDIVPVVTEKIASFEGDVVYTRDTHTEQYLSTSEGKKLPVTHCIKDTKGWQIHPEVWKAGEGKTVAVIDKPTFGSVELGDFAERGQYDAIELIGALFCEVNPIPVKTALNLMGYEVGACKLPLCDMEPKNLETLKTAMKNYGLI